MSNFQFLAQEWPKVFKKMQKAESRINTEPISTANYCRLVLEEMIHNLYHVEYLELPYNDNLVSLMQQEDIKELVPYHILNGLHVVRKTGNNAVHYGRRINKNDALVSIQYMHAFLKWFAGNYAENPIDLSSRFDATNIPKVGEAGRKLQELQKEREKEQQQLNALLEKLRLEKEDLLERAKESEEALRLFKEQTEEARKAVKAQKAERQVEVKAPYNEAQTRLHYINADLQEVGWHDLQKGRHLEFHVTGMPITNDNPKGNGYVDYVLWGDDGKPLAIIEAKRTTKDPEVGRNQASLYADCLEKMFDQRPIIFFTNGFETMLWDDVFYSAARRVYGFYSKEELEWMIQKRDTRKDLRKAKVNPAIAGRDYQMMAIQRIAEDFVVEGQEGIRGNKREALLVMATGSGKTRTAAALVDVLFKRNWVKRVLFLADRNALVTQAKNSFGEHLPDLSSIDLTKEKENNTTRLVFSTYQSMMNCIDTVKSKDDRFYSVGHFDLIIVDEAHRSVYNRYQTIFEYFDAMIVGLTATPKDSIDHNTFELFGCGDGDPTFAYELEDATPTYLCPYETLDVSTKFLREGIKYNELSEKDKEKYEESFQDSVTGLFPEEIQASAMNKRLFNEDTVNKVLDTLMTEGFKIEGGDKIGRTIIFAMNQKHADFIYKCFVKRYPDKPSGFIEVITNKVSHAQSLIDKFCDQKEERNPQIVVSVDMMDTGIDAPRVLNLVFFKVVRSYAKFWQMIGRGTRLCPDVYGAGQDKDSFLILDVCQNFEFFEVNTRGKKDNFTKPITQQIFETRLELSQLLAAKEDQESVDLSHKLVDILHHAIQNLNRDSFLVDMKMRYVEEFKERERWISLNDDDIPLIKEHLSALPTPESIDENARRFDLLILKLQLAKELGESEVRYQNSIINIADELSKKETITEVANAKELIHEIRLDTDFFKEVSQQKLEEIREEIRHLVKYLDKKPSKPIYTNLQDSEAKTEVREPLDGYNTSAVYQRRIEAFIRENKNNITISRIATNQPITPQEIQELEHILFDGEERGSKEDYIKKYGEQPLGNFIRSIVGLDEDAARKAFANFLQAGNLRADQMTFIDQIISHLTENGTIEMKSLCEQPFTDTNDQGIFGVFDDTASTKIISIIREINGNAVAG